MICYGIKYGMELRSVYLLLFVVVRFQHRSWFVAAWRSSPPTRQPVSIRFHSHPGASALKIRHSSYEYDIGIRPSQLYGIRLPRFPSGDDDEKKAPSPEPASATLRSSFIAGLGRKFASKDDPVKEEETPKEDDEGFFRGWFKKDNKEMQQQSSPAKGSKSGKSKQNQSASNKKGADDDSIFKKVQSALPKPPDPFQSQKNATSKKGSEADESTDLNLLGKIQGFFSKNATSDADGAQKKSAEGNATNLNPLSSFQKLFALDRFSPVEEWITVFPKTRIMPGQIVPVTIAGLDLLVVASRDGRKLYCIVNSCPHLGTPLETGTLVRLPREPSAGSSSSNNPRPGTFSPPNPLGSFTEKDLSNLLSQDGCEDCIVCPLHRTAFALESGDVRGEWCPYPPILGNLMGNVKKPVGVAVFDIRTRGKFIQIRLNTPLPPLDAPDSSQATSTPPR